MKIKEITSELFESKQRAEKVSDLTVFRVIFCAFDNKEANYAAISIYTGVKEKYISEIFTGRLRSDLTGFQQGIDNIKQLRAGPLPTCLNPAAILSAKAKEEKETNEKKIILQEAKKVEKTIADLKKSIKTKDEKIKGDKEIIDILADELSLLLDHPAPANHPASTSTSKISSQAGGTAVSMANGVPISMVNMENDGQPAPYYVKSLEKELKLNVTSVISKVVSEHDMSKSDAVLEKMVTTIDFIWVKKPTE